MQPVEYFDTPAGRGTLLRMTCSIQVAECFISMLSTFCEHQDGTGTTTQAFGSSHCDAKAQNAYQQLVIMGMCQRAITCVYCMIP